MIDANELVEDRITALEKEIERHIRQNEDSVSIDFLMSLHLSLKQLRHDLSYEDDDEHNN